MKRCLFALILCSATSIASAQNAIEASGTIAGVKGNRIAIKLESGEVMIAEVAHGANAPSIVVTGTEDPKNLRPGMLMQFQATVAGKKSVVGEVQAATLVSATPNMRLGVLSAEPSADPPGDGNGTKEAADNLENCMILASITRAKNGSVTVAAPGMKPLSFKMAENATIDITGGDISLARIGDKITASGTVIRLPLFTARDIKIEHSPAVDEQALARRLKPDDARPGEKPMPGNKDPFALGDPDDAPSDPAAPKKPRVKLEIIKTN